MSTLYGQPYSNPKNINLSKGLLRFGATQSANPFGSVSNGLYVNDSNELIFVSQGSSTTVGAAGGGGATPSWEVLFANDATFTITPNSTWTIAGNHATATDVVTFTNIAGGSGDVIQITNAGTGKDIQGTSNTWNITKAGVATVAGLVITGTTAALSTTADVTWTIEDNDATALTIDAAGATGLLLFDTRDGVEVVSTSATIFSITGGQLKVLSTSNTSPTVLIDNNTQTTFGNGTTEDEGVVVITSDTLTTGDLLRLQLDESALVGGAFIKCVQTDAATAKFTVGENGATTIAGSAVGTAALTLTAGDLTISNGNVAVTSTSTVDVFSITDNSLLANNALIVKGSGAFTGTGANSFVAITPTGALTGTGLYVALAAATTLSYAIDVTTSTTTGAALRLATTGIQTGVGAALSITADAATTPGASAGEGVVNVSADGLTTGTALNVESVSNELMTSGNLADFTHSASGTTVAAKTGAVVNITSSITESGTSTQDYDVLSVTRTSIHDTAGTLTAQGSLLHLENVATETGATLTDTVIGLEVLMDTQGTGDGVKITHSAPTGKALNIISASTTVSDILITTSGVKANNKGALEVVNTGATAAGGSILRVTNTGTPAAATSYLVDFDYAGMTSTNNPDAIHIATIGTGRAMHITTSGAAASTVDIESTNAGALGPVLTLTQTGGSQAASDVVGRILWNGQDDAAASESYAKIDVIVNSSAAAGPDADLVVYVDVNGTLTERLRVMESINGIGVGSGAAAHITSTGAQDLVLETNAGTNSGLITITDAANGAITIAPNGSGKVDLANAVLMSKTESIGAGTGGAIDVVSSITELATDAGGDAFQLADGAEGQIKFIIFKTDGGGDAVITPANPIGYATITMADVGDAVTLLFTNGKWHCVGSFGATVA